MLDAKAPRGVFHRGRHFILRLKLFKIKRSKRLPSQCGFK